MPLSIFSHLPHLCCSQGVQGARVLCHFQYCFSHLPHNQLQARGLRRLMFDATFNNVSVIYHSFAVGSGFRMLIFYATFNNVSVIYHCFAVGMGVQDAHVLCHFQECFNLLPHLYCNQGIQEAHVLYHFQYSVIYHTFAVARGYRRLMILPLSILFQSFTTLLLQARGLSRLMFADTFNTISVIYHSFAVGSGAQEVHVYCHFQ